jgi:probable rRNA maturation factor
MILLDPDLASDPDPDPRPIAKPGPPSPESRRPERDARLPSVRTLSAFLREAQSAVRLKGQVSVLLTTDKKIKTLNRDFRHKNKATDVLSFPAADISRGEIAGDLAISVDTALKQSRGQRHTLSTEIKVLMLHGLLHLAGYDHEADNGEMAKRERLLRAKLNLPLGLIERAAADTARSAVVLKGHGFSRAAKAPEKARALAPEGRTSSRKVGRTAASVARRAVGRAAASDARSAVGPTAGGTAGGAR